MSIFSPITRTARRVDKAASTTQQRAQIAKQRLAELDERLKKGLITPGAYDKLARVEKAALEYLSKPLQRKDIKLKRYSSLLDIMFITTVLALIGATLLLQHKYGRTKKLLSKKN